MHVVHQKNMFFYALGPCLWLIYHELVHQYGMVWRRSACGMAEVLLFALIVVISSSVLVGWMFYVFLLTVLHV